MRPVYIVAKEVESFAGATWQEAVEAMRHSDCARYDPKENPALRVRREQGFFSLPGSTPDRFWLRMQSCIERAIDQSEITPPQRSSVAIFTGSTAAQMPLVEARILAGAQELLFADLGYGYLAEHLGSEIGLGYPRLGVSLACVSSAGALTQAAELIAAGVLEHAVVLGVEVYNRLTLQGFEGMGLLGQGRLQPFGADRSGMILGEGCAAIVLSSQPGRWRFLGGRLAGENHGVTAHDPEGAVLSQLADRLIHQSGGSLEEISLLKLHGTGGDNSDYAEAQAVQHLFGRNLPVCTALKPYVGHTLGACAVLEMALLLGALEAGFVPGVPFSDRPDPALGIDFSDSPTCWKRGGSLLATHLAFGGMVSALLVEEVKG